MAITSSKDLQKKFHDEMEANYVKADKEHRIPMRTFKVMLNKHGGVETAKRLVKSVLPSDRFMDLCDLKLYRLTAEFLVTKQEFATLFTVDVIEKAKQRLKDFHYENI